MVAMLPRPPRSTPRISRRGALAAAAAAGIGAPLAARAEPAPAAGNHASNVRVATFNAALNRPAAGELIRDLESGEDAQAKAVAEIIQINDPDVLLINELDHDEDGRALALLQEKYLQVGQNGSTPVYYPYTFTAPVNTGEPTGLDLDGDGSTDGPGDAHGFGAFPGQYGMAVLSRYPILAEDVRTFQKLHWASMPQNLLPRDYYGEEAADLLRLSSKSHWDVPVRVGSTTLHVLASHPTPPSFDGPEKRNQRRNHDEIRFWADYLTPGRTSRWIVDDEGTRGGLAANSSFVILGDLNADPLDGDSWPGAIDHLLSHAKIRDPRPGSEGGKRAAADQGGANADHETGPRLDTADFTDDPGPGNLRVDYVLPAKKLQVADARVYWPSPGQAGTEQVAAASDHRLVRLDLRLR